MLPQAFMKHGFFGRYMFYGRCKVFYWDSHSDRGDQLEYSIFNSYKYYLNNTRSCIAIDLLTSYWLPENVRPLYVRTTPTRYFKNRWFYVRSMESPDRWPHPYPLGTLVTALWDMGHGCIDGWLDYALRLGTGTPVPEIFFLTPVQVLD